MARKKKKGPAAGEGKKFVRLLVDHAAGKSGVSVELDAEEADVLVAQGLADAHPDAVAAGYVEPEDAEDDDQE